ncbi:MAG: hypothetical protein LUD77_10050 [Clostridiales bacterium]|nr:hypothetical protein [Clostridiales bacterium]
MEINNEIGKYVGNKKEYKLLDANAKRLFAIKIITAHILKGCLDEFKEFDPYYIADSCIEGEAQISEVTVHRNET